MIKVSLGNAVIFKDNPEESRCNFLYLIEVLKQKRIDFLNFYAI